MDDVAATRGAVADHLTSLGAHDHVEVVTLLVSEVVSNAVLHGAAPRSIMVAVFPEAIHVEVNDNEPTEPVVQPIDAGRIGGNGMRIVEGLSSDWGVRQVDGNGKQVWFDVVRAG